VTHPSVIPVFERFFRSVASIKIDKNDVRRFREFVDEQIDDIAIAGRNSAKWNGRDVIVAQDLPITRTPDIAQELVRGDRWDLML
jgi:hypothetical protein